MGPVILAARFGDPALVALVEQSAEGDTLRALEHSAPSLSYPEIAAWLTGLCDRFAAALVLDATSVGRPVIDMCRAPERNVVAVVVTTGTNTSQDPVGYWHVPERALVASVRVAMQGARARLRVPAALPLAEPFLEAWLSGAHELDIVQVVALALWWSARCPPKAVASQLDEAEALKARILRENSSRLRAARKKPW